MTSELLILAKTGLAALALGIGMGPAHSQNQPPSAGEAPIAYLIDITSGQVLFSRNAERRFVPASMTKVMTLFLAFELIEEGSLSPTQVMQFSESAWEEWAGKGSTMFLPLGEDVLVSELLTAIANVSANDGSIALAEGHSGSVEAWVVAMNEKARAIGMVNSRFGTPNGWPDEGKTFTTARDLALLGETMIERHPDRFGQYIGKSGFTYNGITQPNRDPMIGRVRGADGIKTGYTNEAGFGFLGTAKRDNQRLVMVIAGIDRNSMRARVARQFINWGFEGFDRKELFSEGSEVGRAKVQGGTARSVALETDRKVFVNIPEGSESSVSIAISYNGPIRAPISAGDEVAELVIKAPGMEPARVPLIAKDNVGQAGFFGRIMNGIAGWIT